MLSKLHKIIVTGVLFLAIAGRGQGTFNKYYQSGSVSVAGKVMSLEAGGYLVSSLYVDSLSSLQGLDMHKIDAAGNSQLRKRYIFFNRSYKSFLNNLIAQTEISGSTLLYAGSSNIDTIQNPIIVSVNKTTLDTNWTRLYSDGLYSYYLNNVFRVKANEFWLMGVRFNNAINRPTAIKIDTLGNILSVKEFTNILNYVPTMVCYDTTAKLLYLAGENHNVTPSPQTFVACMDTLGNVLWNQPVLGEISFGRIKKHNNYLVLAGMKFSYYDGFTYYYKMALLKVDCGNGGTIWQRTYSNHSLANYFNDLVINDDESIVAAGTFKYPNIWTGALHEGVILKANSNGDSLWMRTFSNYGQQVLEIFYGMDKTPDGGYIMCGGPRYNNPCMSWVVKTDSMGIGPGIMVTSVNELKANKGGLKLGPNPADDHLSIELPEDFILAEGSEIFVYNNLGQEVSRQLITAKKITLNTSAFPPGMYYLSAQVPQGAAIKSSFIISR